VAKAIEEVLGDRLEGGVVIAKHGDEPILERIEVVFGAHPVPDEGCVEGCRRIMAKLQGLKSEDLVFTIAANGVSALLTMPVPGVTLEDVRDVTYRMQIEHGANTGDLNPIRNHLDMMKGGRISRYLQPATAIHVLAVAPSECGDYDGLMERNAWLHNLPECTTYARAVDCLKRYEVWDEVAPAVREWLERADPAYETVKREEFEKTRFRIFGVMPLDWGMRPTAARKAAELGFTPHILYNAMHADAGQTAQVISAIALNCETTGEPFEPPCVLIGGSEMLVTVGKGQGMGGRNQEFALTTALRIAGRRTWWWPRPIPMARMPRPPVLRRGRYPGPRRRPGGRHHPGAGEEAGIDGWPSWPSTTPRPSCGAGRRHSRHAQHQRQRPDGDPWCWGAKRNRRQLHHDRALSRPANANSRARCGWPGRCGVSRCDCRAAVLVYDGERGF
jgi:glycerate-2-kinase